MVNIFGIPAPKACETIVSLVFQVIPNEYFELLWKPDIYLFSTKEVKINKFLHDYKRLFKLFYGDGDRIGMNVETSVEVWCQMYFEMFPLDTQVKSGSNFISTNLYASLSFGTFDAA